MRLRSIKLQNFKRFERFSVSLSETNVLVGPNNSGKSSILDCLRALHGALRYCRRLNPKPMQDHGGKIVVGYDIPRDSIPITVENITTNYRDDSAVIEFTLENRNVLTLQLHPDRTTKLFVNSEVQSIRTATRFRALFPLDIVIVPTLGPLEEDETPLSEQYFQRHRYTRRSHLMLRNIWYRDDAEQFDEFKELINDAWPDIVINKPELSGPPYNRIQMFYNEKRILREVYWSGFGFQVWLQLITHLLRGSKSSIVVIDEPDIYLHPELQRFILNFVMQRFGQTLIATHSVELINAAEAGDVLLVNSEARAARRVKGISGLQEALSYIGSPENVELARLSRSRKLVFFEGADRKLVGRLSSRQSLRNFSDTTSCTVLQVGGFSQWPKIIDAAWTFSEILKAEVSIFALFDRDYRSAEEVEEFLSKIRSTTIECHVLRRKEIENYLLHPAAIHKAVEARIRERGWRSPQSLSEEWVRETIMTEAQELKSDISGQLIGHRIRYFTQSGTKWDIGTISSDAIQELDSVWDTFEGRVTYGPGKKLLSRLRERILSEYKVSISDAAIVNNMRADSLPDDLMDVLQRLEAFAAR